MVSQCNLNMFFSYREDVFPCLRVIILSLLENIPYELYPIFYTVSISFMYMI
jgi:hypothetical protein